MSCVNALAAELAIEKTIALSRGSKLVLVKKEIWVTLQSEPVFVNVYGAQESIPRNRFRQPIEPGGPVRQIGFRTGPPG